VTSTTASKGLAIRRARDAELRAARLLLPGAFAPGEAPEVLIALRDEALVGAAAVGWTSGGFPLDVHVVRSARRHGVGRALVEAACRFVDGETERLRAWSLVVEGSPAADFSAATGFTVTQRFLGFETDGVKLVEVTGAIQRRLERAGKIPATARLVSLSEAPRGEIIQLVLNEVAVVPATLAARIGAQDGGGYDNDLSTVLMVDGKVGAAALMTRNGDIVRLEVTVVAPALRHGWANALLLGEATRRGIASGAKRCRFFCDEHVRETINAARRIAATPMAAVLSFERRLTPAEGA
jgi:GNAT superfamily N-acetyltransferase